MPHLKLSRPPLVLVILALVGLAGWSAFAQSQTYELGPATRADFAPKDPIKAKTPEEEAKTFVLPPGYRMELVAADPDLDTPSVIEFDGNGRMYVCEFITYMPNADGLGQRDPMSRISRWEDTDGDGKYDKHTTFVDRLVLPRMVLTLDNNSILTNETDSDDVVKWTDTNNDGIADKREVFYSGVGLDRDGNLEHMQSGFMWGLDNWIYSTYNAFRFRWTPKGIIREATGNNQGQWGLTQDDDGKMWFVCAGCERGPLNFQVPIQYGAFTFRPAANASAEAFREYEQDFDIVWPISGLGDMQGGMSRVRMPVGVVNHATATAGPDIVRAHRMPDDLKGDLLFAEPVGRLIRRARIVKTEGLTQLRNVYPKSEFILSTDPLFRPVNIRTAPDGTVYIADMYRGIIQEGEWTRPESYLRRKIEQYSLDKIVHHGRIWRLRFDGTPAFPAIPTGPAANTAIPGQPALAAIEPDRTQPRMLNETPAQLVQHLTHPNGWWRDTAQRLLVLKQDKSVVPALQTMARAEATTGGGGLVARFHALWTLEGLGALDAGLVRQLMKDPNPRLRVQAIRASETLYKAGDKSFTDDYKAMTKDPDVDVALQAMLTTNTLKLTDATAVIQAAVDANKARGIQEIGKILLTPPAAGRGGFGRGGPTPEQQEQLQRGENIYLSVCFACHGNDGRGAPLAGAAPGATMAPPLAGSPRVQGHRDYVIKVLIHGLTGPVADTTYSQVMVPMGTQADDWIAAVGSYLRNGFGNTGSFITPADVARVRAATTARKTSWTETELVGSLPVLLPAQPTWKFSASHNTAVAANALTTQGWSSGEPQAAGMWLQIEFPEVTTLSELQFISPGGGRAGGPGRGAGAPAPGGAAGGAAPAQPPPVQRDYQVQLSTDGRTWGAPVARGSITQLTIAAFAPARARFVRITETAASPNLGPLSIQTLRVYQPPPTAPGR